MDSLTLLDIRSPKWVSLGKNQSVSRAVFLLEALREEFVSLLFSASGSHPCLSSWSCITLTLCGHISFYHPLASLLCRFSRLHWAHLENPGSSPHLKSLNLITSTESLLLPKSTCSHVLGTGIQTFLRNHYSVYHRESV